MTFLLLACAAQPIPNTALPTGPTSFDDWAPFSYRDFANRGGKVVELTPYAEKEPPGTLDDRFMVTITNTDMRDICVIHPDRYSTGVYGLPPIIMVQDNYRYRSVGTGVIEETRAGAVSHREVTVRVKAGESRVFELSRPTTLSHVPPGRYAIFYHIFAPYCRALEGKLLSYTRPFESVLLGLDWTQPPKQGKAGGATPIEHRTKPNERLRFKYLRNGDLVTITKTRGILFTAQLPLEIEGPVESD